MTYLDLVYRPIGQTIWVKIGGTQRFLTGDFEKLLRNIGTSQPNRSVALV